MLTEYVGFALVRAGVIKTELESETETWLRAVGVIPSFCSLNNFQQCHDFSFAIFLAQLVCLSVFAFAATSKSIQSAWKKISKLHCSFLVGSSYLD